MWPTLKQPWYFFELSYIATDAGGNIYVADIPTVWQKYVKLYTEEDAVWLDKFRKYSMGR